MIGDTGAAWMSFRASPQTIDQLITRFIPADAASFTEAGSGPNAPDWWKPEADGITTFYYAEKWSRTFSSSKAFMGVDRHRSIVYFQHTGWD